MKKIVILVMTMLFSITAFAKSAVQKVNFGGKLHTDTISNPKIIGGATYICNEKRCLPEQIKKIQSSDPQFYMILYKISETAFVKVKPGTPISSVLQDYKLNEIVVMNGKIEISGQKYEGEFLVILR